MPEICALATRLYLSEPALTTLHGVTAAQALADLTLRAPNDGARAKWADLWARYWVWLTGLYLEKGLRPDLPVVAARSVGAPTAPSWAMLAAAARAVPEVHLVKLAYSCRWLDETFGPDPLYPLVVVNMLREGTAHPEEATGWVAAPLG